MWGIVPAAGRGSRIQPLAFSKELLPVGSRVEEGSERPMAVSEYLVRRMLSAGATKLCFVISPGKSDIVEYYGARIGGADICYVVQDQPHGLCDALFRPLPFIGAEEGVLIGLPDTVWFPENALAELSGDGLEFLLFPVEKPELFDAVRVDESGYVRAIEVKVPAPSTRWIWGGIRLRGSELRALHELWKRPERGDEYLGTLVNAYLEAGGTARASTKGRAYVDVGTFNGYREAIRLLEAVKLLDRNDLMGAAE
jgi:dTDP-glucose pyrophosphorylase